MSAGSACVDDADDVAGCATVLGPASDESKVSFEDSESRLLSGNGIGSTGQCFVVRTVCTARSLARAIAIVHACDITILHECTVAVIHAPAIATINARIIAIVHACTIAVVHAHYSYITRLHYSYNTRVCYSFSTRA